MTAQEKAKELVEKCYIEIKDVSWSKHEHCVVVAKQCALICVDEIINDVESIEEDRGTKFSSDFWQEVKEAITAL